MYSTCCFIFQDDVEMFYSFITITDIELAYLRTCFSEDLVKGNKEESEHNSEDTDTENTNSKSKLTNKRAIISVTRIAKRLSRNRERSEARTNKNYLCCAWNRGTFWMIILCDTHVFIGSQTPIPVCWVAAKETAQPDI